MPKANLTFDQLRREAVHRLRAIGIENPEIDAKLLLMHAGEHSAAELIAKGGEAVPTKIAEQFEKTIQRRLEHEPVAYIVGNQAFWSLEFAVNPHVLIPRPETEGVVERALDLIRDKDAPNICDIGTGSGAILISLLHERPDAIGIGVDISRNALEIARQNAENIGVASRSRFVESDFLEQIEGPFDLIVSNPPYITDEAMLALTPNVRHYEPGLALRGGSDGLQAYHCIIKGLAGKLKPDGFVVFEIGYDQGVSVSQLLSGHGFSEIALERDLACHDRVISAKLSV